MTTAPVTDSGSRAAAASAAVPRTGEGRDAGWPTVAEVQVTRCPPVINVTISAPQVSVTLATPRSPPYRGAMHRILPTAIMLSAIGLAALPAPARAQPASQSLPIPAQPPQAPPPQAQPAQAPAPQAQTGLPHAWLYGSWTGGLFPPPVTLPAQECLANPTVIFTRDAVLRASPTDVTYVQLLVETVRAMPGGVEFRLSPASQSMPIGPMYGMGSQASVAAAVFGCGSADLLRVQRRGEDQIAFPNCADFPYPLIRCQGR